MENEEKKNCVGYKNSEVENMKEIFKPFSCSYKIFHVPALAN